MRYRFDAFELDEERYELLRDGTVQRVEPLVFDLIRFFVRSPGRVVSRDEMVEAVWQGRVVSDATVAGCIKSARRALGDSGDSQTWIRTVRGRGFEFTGVVEVISPAVPAPPAAFQARSPSSPVSAAPRAGALTPAAAVASAPAAPVAPTPPARQEIPAAGASNVAPRDSAPLPVIAVLPLVNQSAEVDEYFADGLTEDIITNLARFRDLRVIAGASTFRFKGRAVDLAEVCGQLRAGYVVQGSVRRAAGRVRISVQLVDGATGIQVWGDRYDREMVDLFDLQDEVTRTVAAALGSRIQDVALQRALGRKQHELDAYDCLLRARRFTRVLNAESHAEARDLLERAIELDPMSADAHALLANVYLGEHRFDLNPRPNPLGRALVHALAATSLDPQNAYAHCWLAIAHFFRLENDRFETEAQLALSLNPNDPETLADIGHYYAFMGQFERGVELSRRARQLDPLHAGWYHFSSARLNYARRAYDETIADVGRIAMPEFYWCQLLLAAAQGQLGLPEAAASLARLRELKPDIAPAAELRKWNAAPEDLAHILEGLNKAGWRA